MSGVLPLLPLILPSNCTSRDAVPTEAVGNDAQLLGSEQKRSIDVLLVADGSDALQPDVVGTVGPYVARELYSTTKTEAIQLVTTWQEFDDLLKRYSSIGTLVLWTHGEITSQNQALIKIGTIKGKGKRTVTALAHALSQPGMPKVYSVSFEGCAVGIDVQGLLQMVALLELNSVVAWPLYVGFHYTRVSTWPESHIATELTHGSAHTLGPKTMNEIVQSNLLTYSYLYAGDLDDADFPMFAEIPESDQEDPAGFRADQGYLSRARAEPYLIPKDTSPHVEALAYGSDLYSNFMELHDRVPGSDVDPYQHLYQVIVM